MRALAIVVFAGLFTLLGSAGCSGDNKETKAAAPTEITPPPKDVKPKMMDKEAVGFK